MIKNRAASCVILGMFLTMNMCYANMVNPEIVARLSKHVEDHSKGNRSPLLLTKDYYGYIYQCSRVKIISIVLLNSELYEALISCSAKLKILQDFEGVLPRQEHIQVNEEITRKISFTLNNDSLRFKKKLIAPFVLKGAEKRYLVPIPINN